MRQTQNSKFRDMMCCSQHICFISNDLQTLYQKIISSFDSSSLNDVVVVVKRNNVRYLINRIRMKNFIMKNNQKIIIFAIRHDRVLASEIKINDFLNCSNHIKVSSTELFYYIKNASVILLSNLNFSLRLMNDFREFMNDVIFDLNNEYVLKIMFTNHTH